MIGSMIRLVKMKVIMLVNEMLLDYSMVVSGMLLIE